MNGQIHNNWGAVILTGGTGSRIGGQNKAKLQLAGRSLRDRMVETLSQSFRNIALCSGDDLDPDEPLPQLLDVLVDSTKIGPAGGLLAAIAWAKDTKLDGVITVPVDTPLMPDDLFECLIRVAAPAYARQLDQPHWLHAAWPEITFSKIESVVLKKRQYSLYGLHKVLGSEAVDFDKISGGLFHNINTETDLRQAELYISGSTVKLPD